MSNSKTYDNCGYYIADASTMVEKITRLDAVITELEGAALTGAGSAHLEEYWFDDGQSKTKVTYRTVESIMKAITAFEQLRQMYINRLNGRATLLRPARGMRYNNGRG